MKGVDLVPGDDYGMMREMLERRFARVAKERELQNDQPDDPSLRAQRSNPELLASPEEAGLLRSARKDDGDETDPDAFPLWPDLVVIDGGKGQFEAARATLADAGAGDICIVAIAKGEERNAGRETFIMKGREPFKLPPRDPALYFVQRLRDEAHRFAIGTHRAKRKRDALKNPLDEIGGIGPSRKRALLLHFGTVKAIQRAGLEDLTRAPGVNAATAKAVYDFFRDG
jgi:excinuclease ABC subunit C